MWQKIQWIIIIALSVFIVLGIASYIGKGNQINDLKAEKDAISVPKKDVFSKEMTQEDVKRYEDLVNKKMKDFQMRDLDEGVFNANNSGVMTIRGLFSPPGGKIITQKHTTKEYIKHYATFKFKVSDVSAKVNSTGGADVYFKVEVTQDGNKVNPQYNLAKLQFNKDDELTGGSLYEQQR